MTNKPRCKLSDRLAAFADGEADEELARHLPGCASCRTDLDEIRVVLRGIADVAPRPARDEPFWTDFTRAVRLGVDASAERRRRRRFRLAFVLVPILATAVTFSLWVGEPKPTLNPPVAETAPLPPPGAEGLDDALTGVEDLDGDELEDVLAAFDEDEEEDESDDEIAFGDVDPDELIEDLDAEELEALEASL